MGALKDQLKADLTAAIKARDDEAKSNLRMTLGAIGAEEVAGDAKRELSDDEELAVVNREVRKRKDSAEAYRQGGREELALKEEAEANWLSRYLPAPLTESEIAGMVAEEVAKLDEPSMKQMGQVIKAVNARAAGRADGSVIATLVRAALS